MEISGQHCVPCARYRIKVRGACCCVSCVLLNECVSQTLQCFYDINRSVSVYVVHDDDHADFSFVSRNMIPSYVHVATYVYPKPLDNRRGNCFSLTVHRSSSQSRP